MVPRGLTARESECWVGTLDSGLNWVAWVGLIDFGEQLEGGERVKQALEGLKN